MVNLVEENTKNTTDKALGLLINGVELYPPTVLNESIYFGELSSIEILNGGDDYDVITPPNIEIFDVEGYGRDAKAYGNMKGILTEVLVISPGIGYEQKPTLNLTGGNFTGGVELETNLIKKTITSSFTPNVASVGSTTITFIQNHNFITGEEVVYNTNSFPVVTGLTSDSSYFAGVVSPNTISLYNKQYDALNNINIINSLGTSIGINTGIQEFSTRNQKNIIDKVYIKTFDGDLYSKIIQLPAEIYNGDNNLNGINTLDGYVYAKNHNLKNKDLIVYSSTGTPISGLSTTSQYYVTIIDEDRFKLSDAGINKIPNDENYNNLSYVSLSDIGTGNHTFKYPPIEILVSVVSGSSLTVPPILKPIVLGSFDSIFIEDYGVGYGVSEVINLHKNPNVEILDSRQFSYNFTTDATLQPIIVDGKITSVQILNSGDNYQENIDIFVDGVGKYAKLYANVIDNKISSVTVLNTGVGYISGKTKLIIQRRGKDAKFLGNISKWTIDQYFKNKIDIDTASGNGYVIPSRNVKNSLQFINLYPSKSLRESIKDLPTEFNSSPILGWAYDGNPILGPYIYSNGAVGIITSGYSIRGNIITLSDNLKRPPSDLFPNGYFIEDYVYVPGKSILDEHNGTFVSDRLDFPNGTYAYYMTIDDKNRQNPVYPYVIGNTFKNTPNEKNYDSNNNQNINFTDASYIKNTGPLYLSSQNSGYEYYMRLQDKYKQDVVVKNTISSKIDDIKVLSPGTNYKINDKLVFTLDTNQDTAPSASISELLGKNLSSINVGVTTFINVVFKNINGRILGITSSYHSIQNNDYVYISNSTGLKIEGDKKVQVQSKISNLQSNLGASGDTTYVQVNDISGFNVDDFIRIDDEIAKIIQIYPQQSKFFVHRLENIGSHISDSTLVELVPNKFEFIDINVKDSLSLINNNYFIAKNSVGLGTIGSTIVNENTNSTYYVPKQSIYIPNHQYNSNQILKYSPEAGANGLLVGDSGEGSTYRLVDGQLVYAINLGRDYIGISTIGFGNTALFFRESSYLTDEYHSFEYQDNVVTAKVELSTLNITTEEPHELLTDDKIILKGKQNEWEYYVLKIDLNNIYPIRKISNTSFEINLETKPQYIKYAEENSLNLITLNYKNISYTTDSENARGGISKVKILFSSNSYKNIPVIESIISNEGVNGNLLAYSNRIGKIDSIERIKDGFDYPSDVTMQPRISTNTFCYLDNISKISKVNVLFGGNNYNSPPSLKVIGKDDIFLTAKLENSKVESVSIESSANNLSVPLDIIPINNSNGYDILNIYPTSSTTNRIELDINKFPLIYRDYGEPIIDFPFSRGDLIFIENCRIEENNKTNYNSSENSQLYFEVIGLSTSLGQIDYRVPSIGISSISFGTYDILNGYGTIANKNKLARFQMILEKNDYLPQETVNALDAEGNVKFSGVVMDVNGWNKKRSQLRLSKVQGKIELNDTLIGSNSRLQGRVLYSNTFTIKAYLGSTRDKINFTNNNIEDLNSDLKKLQDSDYYQDFSYSIVGRIPYETWKEPVKSIIHPSGFKEFGNLQIISKASNNLIATTTNSILDFNIEIESEKSFFTKNNFTISYEDEKIDPTTSERIYFGSGNNLWPVAGYGNTYINGIELLPYLVNKSNNVIQIKDISSEFTGTYDYNILGNYDVTFNSNEPYYLGISTSGLKVGDIVGYSTYNEYPNNTKILSIGINSIGVLYPHKLYSGTITESLEFSRILNQNKLIGISSFQLIADNDFPIYKINATSLNVDINTNSINLDHNFETGQIIYYENIGGQPIGIVTTTSVIGGISTNILPPTLYAIKSTENKFQVSGLSASLKLEFTSSGSGIHKFVFDSPNASTLITIDNIIQLPLHSRGLSIGLSTSVGIGTSIIYASSGISSISTIDTLKIENEYLKVISVGVGSSNSIEVERGALGSEETQHSGILTTYVYRGNYLINEDIIYFTSPPFGPSGLPGIEVSSNFTGRAFSRTFSSSRPNDRNIILDDISNEFTGTNIFNLKEEGNPIVGLYTNTNDPDLININNNPIILINNIPQITHTDFEIIDPDENKIEFISGVPNSGRILSVGVNTGYGYMPLAGAAASVSVSIAGTISEVYLNGAGAGYRLPPVINIYSNSGYGASISATIGISGTITNLIIQNPGVNYDNLNPPIITIDNPLPYYDLNLVYASGSSGIGENATVSLAVDTDSIIENVNVINSGIKYKVGDVLNVVGLVTDSGVGASFNEFSIIVKEVYSDTFSGIYPGQFLQFDDISREFNSIKKVFNIITTINGEKSRLTFKSKSTKKIIENNFFIFINDVLQKPQISYRYIGGRIVFSEAPKEGSKCNILYYQGSIYDTTLVVPIQIFKEGDVLKFEDSELSIFDTEQTDRIIKRIVGSNNLDTFPYDGVGISSIVRPISWTKQKNDRLINGSLISKSRTNQSSRIYPTAKLIWNVSKDDTAIYVDNAYPLFIELDNGSGGLIEEKRNIKIFKDYVFESGNITPNVSGTSTISSVFINDAGNGYNFIPTISISDPPVGMKDPLYNWNNTSGISTTFNFNSIVQGDVIIAVGNSNLVAISTNLTDWNFDAFNYNETINLQKINVANNINYITVGSSGKIFKKQTNATSWSICGLKTETTIGLSDSQYVGIFNDVIYNENIDSWIAVGNNGKIYSGLGIETDIFIESISQNIDYKSIDYNSNIMISVGYSGISWGINGKTWYNVTGILPSVDYTCVLWDGSRFIVTSNVGIYTSVNGTTDWSIIQNSPSNLKKITLYDGVYIGVDSSGNIYHSLNLSNWELRTKPTTEQANDIKTVTLNSSYFEAVVGTSGTIFYSIPTKHKANIVSSISNGSIQSITVLDGGFGYSSNNLPFTLIEPPISEFETIYAINAVGDFGTIVGIKTSNTGISTTTPSISFELLTDFSSGGYDSLNTFGITYSNLSVGDYFIITNSNINTTTGYALTGITTSLGGMSNYPESRVGTATSYIDGVYKVEYVNTATTPQGITTVTCNVVPVNGRIGINTSGITGEYYGNYSWGKIINYENRQIRNPLEYEVNTNNGLVGLSTAAIIHRIPPLIF